MRRWIARPASLCEAIAGVGFSEDDANKAAALLLRRLRHLNYQRLEDNAFHHAAVIDFLYSESVKVHVGCSGWFYWHWRGIFYPDTKRTDTWFKLYVGHFDTVELNAPFYSWPKQATVRSWCRNAPQNFRYSVKVNRLITHEKRLVRTKTLVKKFCEIERILGHRLGCFLFQFPPSYKYTASRLRSIVNQLDPKFRPAVEFRHQSWWRKAVYRAFDKRGLIFCSVSSPRLPPDLINTADVLYIRFHGTSRWYRHDYSADELADWADKIRQSNAREAWIYFNNDREGFAIKNARELRRMLEHV